ncbi:MAG: hypothetical protein HOF08_03215 [Candidatus Pacebacteria bacterium]|nr:hypothetical protein [Candidatus Paceibacterota bacterium]MBT4680447.1 hypothetical protein [Candidatus Paceibacterota bacterium]
MGSDNFLSFSIAFVWIELLPTEVLINKLFQSESFLEVFRNPFTKFSILYSFVSVLLFVKTIEVTVGLIKNKFLIISFLTILNLSIAYQAWPSFQGHFISEKLRIEYPTQYWDMFEYLQAKDEDLRILQLPQRSHAGWEYYDWSFLKPGNGYQGMGFYFFGFPQPFLNRDSDRWVETSDFFYHELKYALDTKNSDQFIKILDKYEVDLLIIDETKIEPGLNHNYNLDHQLAIAAGLEKIWEQDFITIYQKQTSNQDSQLLIPTQITPLSADTDRIRKDYVYSQHDDYLLTDGDEASLIYPFANLMSKEASNVSIGDNQTQISTNVQKQDYHLKLPGLKDEHYFTPINISYKDQKVKVEFPTNKIDLSDKTIILPKLNDFEFKVSEDYSTIIVFFNKMGIIIDQGKTATPVISLEKNQPISVSYTEKSDDMVFSHKDELTNPNLEITPKLDLDLNWQQLQAGIDLQVKNLDQINLISEFPHIPLDLSQNPSVNCSADESGQIVTKYDNGKITYQADAYAVSCNSYSFNYMSPAYSYLMNISGHNYQGRSTKFFINYSVSGVSPEAYLMPNGSFDIFLTLHQVSEDPNSRHYLNWETRSFGKLNIDEINGIKIAPFPLEQMSKLSIFKDKLTPLNNDQLEIRSDIILFDSTHLINFRCKQEKCYLGIDQSYDDLWIGLEVDELKLLSHHRLNNWANLWEINKGEGRIIIFYLPEVISLFSLILLGTTITFLIIKLKKTTNVKKYPKIKHKTKRHLRGK